MDIMIIAWICVFIIHPFVRQGKSTELNFFNCYVETNLVCSEIIPIVFLANVTEVRVHCTFRTLSGVVLVVGTGLILRRCSTLGDFVEAFRVATLPAANALRAISEGSVCFTVQAETSLALEELEERYSSGRLQTDLQKFLVTDDIIELADGEEVVVSVYIDEREFREALYYLTNVDQEGNLA